MDKSGEAEGKLLGAVPGITIDRLQFVQWKTADGRMMFIKDMTDNHVRNVAMFLAGFGFRNCIASEEMRILWLRVMKMEWDRRMYERKYGDSKRFKFQVTPESIRGLLND